MKKMIYLLVLALMAGGCTYKNEAIELSTYKGEYAGNPAKENKAVYLQSVNDLRADKNVIGYTLSNDQKDEIFRSNVDFKARYTTGLRYALDLAGYKVVSTINDANLVLDVNIKNIEIIYDDKTFETNLKGALEIEVVVKKDNKITRQNFRPKASTWITPSHDSKDIEPFLYTLFSENINEIASNLAKY